MVQSYPDESRMDCFQTLQVAYLSHIPYGNTSYDVSSAYRALRQWLLVAFEPDRFVLRLTEQIGSVHVAQLMTSAE